MPAREIKPDVYWIGVNDRTTDLFEGLWPISVEGVSYNSYLIMDEKRVIIDLTKSNMADAFLGQLEEITDVSRIDYIVLNHMEPDHSGLLRTFRRLAPHVIILCSARAQEMLKGFFSIEDGVRVVGDGETLELGRRSLKFFSTPFVHWPETIMTYEVSHRILFSCDGFGGYGTTSGAIFDDECKNLAYYEREALRYYANIVANYSSRVLDAISRAAAVPVNIIAPSHGLIWRREPHRIIQLYKKWAEFADGPRQPGIALIYGSMYGHTEKMMNAVAQGISRTGIGLEIFDASRTHVSYILPSLWCNEAVMIGAPTYEVKLFPPVAEVLNMAINKRILGRKAAYFGSYGWSGGALKELKEIIGRAKWELWGDLVFRGNPTGDDLRKGEEFGQKFAQYVQEKLEEKPSQRS
ncbi:MAG: FprA family A-type flavoprotein [Candidatus Aminicenantes bacterium]|nr:FprA family A-type flavoprotein [Candidatus Aminicenantes bacterium]